MTTSLTLYVNDDPAVVEAHERGEHPRPLRDCRACVEAWQRTAHDQVRPVVPYVQIDWGF